MGTRGDFYDRTGALRDMVQNHALQLLTMIAMEPPATGDADAIRDEKLKVLRSLKPFTRRERGARRGARPVPRRHDRRQAGAGLPRRGQGAGRTAAARPSSRCAPRCRTGAGPACRSTCAPASAWPRATRRSSSTSGPVPHPIFPGASARQQAGHQAAARRRAGAAPAGRKGGSSASSTPERCRRCRSTWTSTRRFAERARRRLRAAAARRDRRPAEPVRAQRRAGAGLALGRADARRLAQRQHRPAPLRRRHLGAAGVERADRARRLRLGRGRIEHRPVDARPHPGRPAGAAAGRAARGQAGAGRRAQLCQPAGQRAGRALACEQAHGGALLPQRRLRRPGRLQAASWPARQRRRALRAPRGRRGRQDRRHRGQGDRQRGQRAA